MVWMIWYYNMMILVFRMICQYDDFGKQDDKIVDAVGISRSADTMLVFFSGKEGIGKPFIVSDRI